MLLPLLLLGLALVAGGVTAVAVELVRGWAARRALLDLPNERSSHHVPTPRPGGLAFVPVLLVGLALWWWCLPVSLRGDAAPLLATIAAALFIAGVSLRDDVRPLPPVVRLCAHLAGAALVMASVGGVRTVTVWPLHVDVVVSGVSLAVGILWAAWFVNAFNFMDGVDGIAGTQALVAGLAWVAYGALVPSVFLMGAGALLAGTMAGFLLHNWPPARIFMGDVGSAVLGLLLATTPWVLGPSDLLVASMLPLWPFLFDTGLTLVRRGLRGERLWEAHRSHLYQRLVISGWSHRAVSLLYGGLAAAGAVAGVVMLGAPRPLTAAWPLPVVAGALVLCATVAYAERASLDPARPRTDA